VDTRGDLVRGAEWAAAVREVTKAPWTVAITHSHWDHLLRHRRVPAQRGLGAPGVPRRPGGERHPAAGQTWRARYREYGRPDLTELADLISVVEPVLPDRLVLDRTELTVGGRTVVVGVLRARPQPTTTWLVHVPDADVVFAGDLVEQGAPPSFRRRLPPSSGQQRLMASSGWPQRWCRRDTASPSNGRFRRPAASRAHPDRRFV